MKRHFMTVCMGLMLVACATTTNSDQRVDYGNYLGQRPEIRPIKDLKEVSKLLEALPRSETLVIFDIDDTLLTSPDLNSTRRPQFFGSDRWFIWQDKELKKGDTDKLACLFDVIAINYEVATQQPTQPDAAEIVNRIANDKLMLTSRSPAYRGGTERELEKADFDFMAPLGSEKFLILEGSSSVPMTYINGILMTRGADKGKVLQELLKRTGLTYRNIVLVDDTEKNIESMRKALSITSMKYFGLRYENVKADPPPVVTDAQIAEHRKAWRDWLDFLASVYPEREARLQSECKEAAYAL